MNIEQVREILNRLSYKPEYSFRVDKAVNTEEGRLFLQVCCHQGLDADTGKPTEWRGRKWYLSEHMCPQEIVGTAFLAVLAAEEHEVRDWFRLDSQPIYSGHVNPFKLADLMQKESLLQLREHPMTLGKI